MSIFGRTAPCFTPGPVSECSVVWVLEDSNPLLQNICRSQPPATAGSWKLTSMEMPVMLTQPALPSVSEELVFWIMNPHRNCSHFIMFLIHGFCVFDFCKILPSHKIPPTENITRYLSVPGNWVEGIFTAPEEKKFYLS